LRRLPIGAAPSKPPPGATRLLRGSHLRARGRAAGEVLPPGLARPESSAAARLTAVVWTGFRGDEPSDHRVSTFMKFVIPGRPTGTPAVMTTVSPRCTRVDA